MQRGAPSPGTRPERPQWWPMFTGHGEVAYVPAPWVLNTPIPGTARVHQVPRTPPPRMHKKTATIKQFPHISRPSPRLKCDLSHFQVLAFPKPLEPQASTARSIIFEKDCRVEPQGPRMSHFRLGAPRGEGLVTSSNESLLP